MEDPIKDPLDVSNELAEREKLSQSQAEKSVENETKSEEESEERPQSTELVILNPSDVIIDKNLVSQFESSEDTVQNTKNVEMNVTEKTKTDANRNEVKSPSPSTISEQIHESSSSNKVITGNDDESDKKVEETSKSTNKSSKNEEKSEKPEEKEDTKKCSETITNIVNEDKREEKDVEDTNSNTKNNVENTENVQSNTTNSSGSTFEKQQTPEEVITTNSESCSNSTSNVQKQQQQQTSNNNDKQTINESDEGNNSVLKQMTDNSTAAASKEDTNNEEEEVSVSFLDRVIKHALNNTLPIGNFDSSKPFEMVNRRPGGLPNFNHPAASKNESEGGARCDNDKEVISDLKGGTNSNNTECSSSSSGSSNNKGTVSVQFLANSNQQNLPSMPKNQETMSENNQNPVVDSVNQKFCDANESNNKHSVQQPVVTSSVVVSINNTISTNVQSTSQMSNIHDDTQAAPPPPIMRDKTEFTRQEIIDSKYKTKEDLKNARMNASRLESNSNDQSLDLSVSHPSSAAPPPPKKSLSLYVSNPDFSKKIFTAPEITSPSSNPLHVRPPDFNRAASQTKELQIPNPVFKLKGGNESNLYNNQNFSRSTVPMTQEQLAELSKTHNYIPDLRLKSATAAPIPVIHTAPSTSSSIKKTTFEEEPPPHVIDKGKYQEPIRIEEKMERHVESKVHYPPYKPKHVIEQLPPTQYKHVVDVQSDLRHLRMESKDVGSSHHKSKDPYTEMQKYPHVQKHPVDEPSMKHHTSFMYKMEEPKFNIMDHHHSQQQKEHEFSLKEKERQLRQEGTIITVKPSNEPVKVIPQMSQIPVQHGYGHHLQQSHPSTSMNRAPEPAKLTKENVDRHARETKHMYLPGHPSLMALSKDMPLTKPRIMDPSYQKPETHHPSPELQKRSSGYYQPYSNENVKGSSYQKHPSYMHPPSPVPKSGTSEIAYYPHPPVSPHGAIPRPANIPVGTMNPPMNWPNQRMAPSPHAANVSPINNMIQPAPSPVFIHPSSKHSPSPTQFSRPPVAQSPTNSNKSVSPQLVPSQYRQVSYSPVHMQPQKHGHDDKYRQSDQRRVVASPSMPPSRHVVVYENASGGPRKYDYVEAPKNSHQMRQENIQPYPMKYNQSQVPPPHHEVPQRHSVNSQDNRGSREYEMHKYNQYPDRVEFRRSESDLSHSYANEPPLMHKRDDYRSSSVDRAAYERQKEYDYRRGRMPSSSPTESYKIQLDISAAIKHETNRNEPPSRHHDTYHHAGPSSRATMEVQSSPSPSHYQASILIRPSPSPSNPSRMEQAPSHIKTEAYVPPKEVRAQPSSVIATPNHVVQARPSVVAQVMKRESPLDLSVKTVKTKADSTGSDLSQQMYRRVDERYVLPKVEFQPNFTQHQPTSVRPVNERNPPPPEQFHSHRSVNAVYEVVPNKNKGVSHIPMHHQQSPRIQEPANVKYYEQNRHQEPKPPHQVDDRTIHIAVGEPYRHEIPSNSHKQIPKPDIHPRHAPYSINDRPGPSSMKPIPNNNQVRGSVINNPNDPQRLEDRKYVESILYKKQPPPSAIANAEITFRYVHDKHSRPISPPRKRSLEYNEGLQIPPKQIRYEHPPREMTTHSPSHVNPQQPQSYPYDPKMMHPRESNVEIHAHKMIYERYPPESHTLQPLNQYPKSNENQQRYHGASHMYPDPRQPESKSHATVVKTIPKDSFRHDPKDEPRAGFPPPLQTQPKYPPGPFFPRPSSMIENERMQKQTAVTWHPSAPPQSHAIQSIPDRFDVRNQYNASADALVTEKCETPMDPHLPVIVDQKSNEMPTNSMNANKGADINTINKLRTSIEQKEIERQRLMMRKQNSSEISEDDSNKPDIASILAARIRTKGELKGFTPTPVVDSPSKDSPVELPKDPIEPPADIEGTSAFDVMDWGNACNDFVDQLQTGKKRGRRKRTLKTDETNESKIDPYINTNAQSDNLSTVPVEVLKSIQDPFSNSSDEDKPLKLLRQQSTPECKDEDSVDLRKGSETCSSAIKSSGERSCQSIRKKQRLVLEQKIAARIGTGSSSDTEPEEKPSVRTRKRKLRTRSSLGMKEPDNKSQSNQIPAKSDDDSSSEVEEKVTKRISQLDGSSDSDNNKEKGSKKFRKTRKSPEEVKQKRLSRHEKHSEQSDHSEGERRKSKSRTSKRNKSKNSESEGEKEETMTRSKRKLEMEKKISNSKVLRNEKIVQNVTVKKPKNVQEVASKANKSQQSTSKKKDEPKNENKRKILESDCEHNKMKKRLTRNLSKLESSATSSDDDEEEDKSDRLRPRKSKSFPSKEESEKGKRKNSKVEEPVKTGSNKKVGTVNKKMSSKSNEVSQTKYPPGWEAQLYAFKKSLKIPARLINVTPNNQRYSTSLPDLDPQSSDDASEFSETSKASSFLTHIKTEETENETSSNHRRPTKKSIIDLLHQRVTPSLNKMMQKKKIKEVRLPQKNTENEPLPIPTNDQIKTPVSEGKKSIFDLSVLKSRTRNEQKHMKHKEIIREIFCGEDRPSSAPPLGLDLDTTFDQKFGQIMKKMDEIVASTSKTIKIKQEKIDDTFVPPQDEETTDTVLNVNNDRDGDDNDRDLDTPSVNSERDLVTPVSFKDMPKPVRKGRQSRRKQSSGFDYIRKKKKPVTNSDGTPVATKRRIAAVNYLQEKDENDISKEVKGWVLNKGVGESYLHKAARLGYLDVIAYCLFRIDMDVDTKDNAGYTALHEACSKGNLGIVRLLLQCGANHSETAFSGIRPLHEAVQHNYTEIARLLLAYGADPSLSTYSGQTPEMLAETKEMTRFISNYLKDMQGGVSPAWKLHPPWQQYDSDNDGLDIFDGVSELFNESSLNDSRSPVKTVTKTCDSNLNNIIKVNDERLKYKSCTVVLNNIDHIKSFSPKSIRKSLDTIDSTIKSQFCDVLTGNIDSDGEMFEFEESEHPLPPLYLLQDEGSDKWIMLSDLCNILKVKSKDAVLKQIDPTTPTTTLNKELVRELKISEFIEKATCLQLLCAGEKLNVRASKVVLVRYNDAVKKLMNVQTIVLKF